MGTWGSRPTDNDDAQELLDEVLNATPPSWAEAERLLGDESYSNAWQAAAEMVRERLFQNGVIFWEGFDREEELYEDGMSDEAYDCLLYTSPSPRDKRQSRMPSSA